MNEDNGTQKEKEESSPVRLMLQSGAAGLLVGGGLLIALLVVKGWAVGLLNSPYCGAAGALVAGLFFAGRYKGPDGFRFILAALLGLPVALIPPLAAWLAAPLAGFGTGPFSFWSQMLLGVACGWVGAWLGGRRSRLPDEVEKIRRRRLEEAQDRENGIRRGRRE